MYCYTIHNAGTPYIDIFICNRICNYNKLYSIIIMDLPQNCLMPLDNLYVPACMSLWIPAAYRFCLVKCL